MENNPGDPVCYREPVVQDAPSIYQLVKDCPPLDLNSRYHYLLLAQQFHATSIVAQCRDELVGYISAYIHPQKAHTLFVWQVAVSPVMRGRRVALSMLLGLLARPALAGLSQLETTVTPSNTASQRLFRSLAERLQTRCEENEYFPRELFGNEGHEAERLFCIGPFTGADKVYEQERRSI